MGEQPDSPLRKRLKKRGRNKKYYKENRERLIAVAAKWNKENKERRNEQRKRRLIDAIR